MSGHNILLRVLKTSYGRPHLSVIPNGISIGSAVYAGLIRATHRLANTQTDHASCDICRNRPLFAMQATRLCNRIRSQKMHTGALNPFEAIR